MCVLNYFSDKKSVESLLYLESFAPVTISWPKLMISICRYVEKQMFLERADLRQFEKEKAIRDKNRKTFMKWIQKHKLQW